MRYDRFSKRRSMHIKFIGSLFALISEDNLNTDKDTLVSLLKKDVSFI